mmetsp:Transcript_129772/g.225521  ORF Transcript_129772/g.225521 Transcript_129772/m.225521 type:complete len:330 (+) Transcript_129772:67-1056(+)
MTLRLSWSMLMTALALACISSCGRGRRLQWKSERVQGYVAAFNTPVTGRQARRPGCGAAVENPAAKRMRLRTAPLMRQTHKHPQKSDAVTRRAMMSTLLAVAATVRGLPALAGDVTVGGDSFPTPGAPKDERTGLKARWLEKIRIFLQDEADNINYDGELAPGGPPPANPALMLLPVVSMQATLKKVKAKLADQTILSDTARWDEVLTIVSTGPFEPRESKRIFNAYSDNIYYKSGSAEANIGLLGGSTPSTGQTMQYLWRNEALNNLDELCEEIKYQKGLAAEKRETAVAQDWLKKVLKAFDEYLKLAPEDELKFAREGVYGTATAAK